MDAADIGKLIQENVPREALVDFLDEFVAQSRAAYECIRDHSGLDGKRARRAIGFVRFLMNERAFESIAAKHGASGLIDGRLPRAGLVAYQPYKIFGNVVLGFASHLDPGDLPTRNQTRRNAVQLNLDLSPHLDIPSDVPPGSEIFALLILSRDSAIEGSVREVAIAVIDAAYDQFLFYEPLEKFVMRYNEPSPREASEKLRVKSPLVKIKTNVQPFGPSNTSAEADDKRNG